MNRLPIYLVLFLFLPVILAGAVDIVGDISNQPNPDKESTGDISIPNQYTLNYGSIPPSEYDHYVLNTSQGKLDLMVVNGTGLDISETFYLLNATTQMGLASPPVTGYIINPKKETWYKGRARHRSFWSEPEIANPLQNLEVMGRRSLDHRARSMIVHEYVHTGQSFMTYSNMNWYTEGEADFYSMYIPQREGTLSAGRYNAEMIRRYLKYKSKDVTLGNLSQNLQGGEKGNRSMTPDYIKGSIVVSALDGEIREETRGNKTILNLSRTLRRSGGISQGRLENRLEEVTGSDMSNWTEKYISGNETPVPRLVNAESPLVLFSTSYWLLAGIAPIVLAVIVLLGWTWIILQRVRRYLRR